MYSVSIAFENDPMLCDEALLLVASFLSVASTSSTATRE